jgi:chemotaxis protein histidine kinase CheA
MDAKNANFDNSAFRIELLQLSEELIFHIFSFLGPNELLCLGQTCVFLREIADRNEFWHPIFSRFKKKPCLLAQRRPVKRISIHRDDDDSDISEGEEEEDDEEEEEEEEETEEEEEEDDNDEEAETEEEEEEADESVSQSDTDNQNEANLSSDEIENDSEDIHGQMRSAPIKLDLKTMIDPTQNYYNWKKIFLFSIEYETLEEAVSFARDDDVIILPQGRYVIDRPFSITKSISIIGDDFPTMNTKYFTRVENSNTNTKTNLKCLCFPFHYVLSFFVLFSPSIQRTQYSLSLDDQEKQANTSQQQQQQQQQQQNQDKNESSDKETEEKQKHEEQSDQNKVIITSNRVSTLRWNAPYGRLQVRFLFRFFLIGGCYLISHSKLLEFDNPTRTQRR